MSPIKLFSNKKWFVIIIVVFVALILGINIYFLNKKRATPSLLPEEYPYKYDFKVTDVIFGVRSVNKENKTASLEFFLPKQRVHDRITSKLECSDNDTKIIYEPNLSKEDQAKMQQELSTIFFLPLEQTSSFEQINNLYLSKRDEIMQKYGYRMEQPNNNLFEIVADNLGADKQITLEAKCSDTFCSLINKDCQVFIR